MRDLHVPAAEHEHVHERLVPGVHGAGDVRLDARFEVDARLLELRAQAVEQVVRLDALPHLLRVIEHHVGEDGAREPRDALGLVDRAHRRRFCGRSGRAAWSRSR